MCRLSGCEESSLNGSYRQNSEFFKKEDQQQSCSRTEVDKSSDKAKATNQNISLTWDTLKKIRRQKSRRNANAANSDLKKYQSSVCLLETQNTFLSLQSDERQQRRPGLQHNLKYDEVYRSSPSLRSVQSFICHDGRQSSSRHNFTFSKQFSNSALRFTGR